MSGTVAETRPETRRQATRAVLVFVLNYDDLLADDGRVLPLDGTRSVEIGRADVPRVQFSSETTLAVPDARASGSHARLDRKGKAHTLTDLNSSNGTRVNGQIIRSHRLADGDLIEIGRSLFVYRVVDERLAETMLGPPVKLGPTVTRNPEMLVLVRDLTRMAASTEPILILAETGAGKEVVAQAAHDLSGRHGHFCAVDCGAIPENLFESTLFGHRKGAFTGADESRRGEISRSSGGTLFLDEVGNLVPSAQAKLLRVLETAEVTPVGAQRPERVDLRTVAATNVDLFDSEAGFREDLLRRLAGWTARVPPLRSRREDLGTLTAHLLRQSGAQRVSIRPEAGRRLFGGPFTGNIRELRTVLRSATLLAAGEPIDESHLPAEAEAPAAGMSEREALEHALTTSKGNVSGAARALGTHARQVYRWIERYELDIDAFRA